MKQRVTVRAAAIAFVAWAAHVGRAMGVGQNEMKQSGIKSDSENSNCVQRKMKQNEMKQNRAKGGTAAIAPIAWAAHVAIDQRPGIGVS